MINEYYEWKKRKEQGQCPDCERDMKDAKFDDDISRREFKISGLCQVCQDNVFNSSED